MISKFLDLSSLSKPFISHHVWCLSSWSSTFAAQGFSKFSHWPAMDQPPGAARAPSASRCSSEPSKCFQFLGVCRHAERADDVGALVDGLPWCLLEDSKQWPYDPPLSDAGLLGARELGLKFRKMLQELDTDLHVVITSPFLRCVQTAAMICQPFGRGTKLLIDNSLAEIYGPCIIGDAEPDKPVRPLQQSADFCLAHGVESLEVRRLVGKWPSWPETLKGARARFATRFVEYLKRGHKASVLTTCMEYIKPRTFNTDLVVVVCCSFASYVFLRANHPAVLSLRCPETFCLSLMQIVSEVL